MTINWTEVERIRGCADGLTYDESALLLVIDQLAGENTQLKTENDALRVALVEAGWHGTVPPVTPTP